MNKTFVNSQNKKQLIIVTKEYIELVDKTTNSKISDLYYLKQTGYIEKCECRGTNSCMSIWNIRKGWKPTLKLILQLKTFEEALNIINKKIDNNNLFIKK